MNNNKEIINELKEISSVVAAQAKQNGIVPEGYFEIVEEQIISQILVLEALQTLPTPETPDGYFDNFEIKAKESLQSNSRGYLSSIKLRTYRVAAILILGLIGSLLVFTFVRNPEIENQKQLSLSSDEYLEYISSNIDEFDLEILIDEGIVDESSLEGLSQLEFYNSEDLEQLEYDF